MRTQQRTQRRLEPPTLRFNPHAWAKLLFLRDAGETEVGGFGITSANDLLLVEDVQLVGQECTAATVNFDDEAVADFFDRQIDEGRKPEQFARIWLHTHPGDCPLPSGVDEETFERVFGSTDWTMMFIFARGGQTYARLRFHVGPGGSVELPVDVDYGQPFDGSDHVAWQQEYDTHVRVIQPTTRFGQPCTFGADDFDMTEDEHDAWVDAWDDYVSADWSNVLVEDADNA